MKLIPILFLLLASCAHKHKRVYHKYVPGPIPINYRSPFTPEFNQELRLQEIEQRQLEIQDEMDFHGIY